MDPRGQHRGGNATSPDHSSPATSRVSNTASGIRRPHSDESWIEVSSQPSSSSLSSVANDEIITTGLRVTQSMNSRRRRRLHRSIDNQTSGSFRFESTMGSSQDEYDESEIEGDRRLNSSNEAVTGFVRENAGNYGGILGAMSSSSETHPAISDDDENATALGVAEPSTLFTPQPNAFTYPPSLTTTDTVNRDSYFVHSHSSNRHSQGGLASTPPTSQPVGRQSYPSVHQRRQSHTPYNLISPNHSLPIDHDAALRASLSTLLSCAAAARGLPKRDASQTRGNETSALSLPTRPIASNRIDQGTLRIIPESSMDSMESPGTMNMVRRHSVRSSSEDSSTRVKRKSKSPSQDRRRKRRAGVIAASPEDITTVSPTLMTWVAGVGVVVLFSAISFSAGYALGKDVGRFESSAACGLGNTGSDSEAGFGRSLRERSWRWANTAGGVRV